MVKAKTYYCMSCAKKFLAEPSRTVECIFCHTKAFVKPAEPKNAKKKLLHL